MPNTTETLNKMAAQQQETGQKMVQLLNNMKREATAKRSPQWASEQLQKMEQLWKRAQKIDTDINEVGETDHTYFTTSYFSQIKQAYEEAVKYLSQYIKSEESLDNELEKSNQRRQQVRIQELQHLMKTVKEELLEQKSRIRYTALTEKLKTRWDAVQQLQEEIMMQHDSQSDQETYWKLENEVDNTMEQLESRIHEISTTKPNITLPKIQLPIFTGGYDKWTTFHDIFIKVIHTNAAITKVEKMQYLKTHVQGEPSRIIQHLQISDGNYEAAWELLERRFQNKRLIISKLVDKLMDQPASQKESARHIKELHDTTNECVQAINNMGIDTSTWAPLIGRILSRKWDPETNKIYEQSIEAPNEIQTLPTIMNFLEKRFKALEGIKQINDTHKQSYAKPVEGRQECTFCSQNHTITWCTKFQNLTTSQRNQAVEDKRLCFNCLGRHPTAVCRTSSRCQKCSKKHHTLLHQHYPNTSTAQYNSRPPYGQQPPRPKPTQATRATVQAATTTALEPQISVNSSLNKQEETVLLATALVQAKTAIGTTEYLRVLVDTGSQASFITEQAAQMLAQPRRKIQAEVTGLGGEQPKIAHYKIQVKITPRVPSTFSMEVDFLILPKLTTTMPSNFLETEEGDNWTNKILADPTYNHPGPIDAILGAKEFGQIIQAGMKKTDNGLLGQETKIGWILSGCINKATPTNVQITSMISRSEEDKQLTKFWSMEEVPEKKIRSPDEQRCEEKYKQTSQRGNDGTYTVQIPFKEPQPQLGNSKQQAIARFLQLEQKLSKNQELAERYAAFMEEYLKLGHMYEIPKKQQDNKNHYYIPHQPVIREASTTTKLRVVFDASAKTSNGISFNDTMHVGPRLQQELTDILIRWRKHKVVLSADIEKMYRQIKLAPRDQDYHRIVWRFSKNQPIREYKLTTVTYGTAAAPYLAIRTLQQLANDEYNTYPAAAEIVKQDFYVDDLMSGANTIEEARHIRDNITSLLQAGGFNLRKWSSNKVQILDGLAEDQATIEIIKDETKKALGVHWAPSDDTFRFKVQQIQIQKVTKRSILSEIAKLFDPLGLLAPIIIKAKLFIQELWLEDLDWDKAVPERIQKKWTSFYNQLKSVEEIRLPRWIQFDSSIPNALELHGFCDASEKAYGAVIYTKQTNQVGQQRISLLTAKSKVAPVRTRATLPKLELSAAVLLAKLMKQVTTALAISNTKIYAWTDSMITLGWLRGDPSRWKTFVANRVAEITNVLPPQHWNYINTKENPADVLSRGIDPSKLSEQQLWWHGPTWLHEPKQWPVPIEIPTVQLEKKISIHISTCSTSNVLIEQFSSKTRMVRVLTFCRRFGQKPRQTGPLTVAELEDTLKILIRQIQEKEWVQEYKALQQNKPIPTNSKLLPLNPFMDIMGIIRVGGRLHNSTISYDQKHPIIIPHQNHMAKLIIRDAHHGLLHGGVQLTLAFIRRKYWITNGKNTIRSIIHTCTTCTRHQGQAAKQLMGNLPAARVSPSPPFLHTGVDYAGPIQVRATKGRGHKSYKGYICIFVCLATKAIHLEAVSDMTTEAFLAALRRFVARRGRCAHIYSDNGTNFIGAKNTIEKAVSNVTKTAEVQDTSTTIGMQWHCIPPAAPHMGGLWEAGVKSTKFHLKRVIGTSTLTYEELATLLYQIEACLNARPLCTLSNDSNDLNFLTPGHFLIGRELLSPADPVATEITPALSTRWKVIQKMKTDFWKIWSNEYLHKLQQRYKWKTAKDNVQIGDVIIIKDETVNPAQWPLAKIVQTHPDSQGMVRTVTVKKANGNTTTKSIHHIIPLPIAEEAESSKKTQTNAVNCTTISRTVNQKNTIKRSKTAALDWQWQVMIITLLSTIMIKISTASYVIHNLTPGLYIEHIGHARIEKGIFRIELKYELDKMSENQLSVITAISNFEDLCNQTKKLSDETRCTTLTHHLKELGRKLQWVTEGIIGIHSERSKRGLLGDLLTSIFGVNDKVYQNIEDLRHNQQELIRSSNQQTKFMISALSTFNETEARIYTQLELFRRKLNEGLETIHDMRKWYNTIDENKMNIHLLSTYQIAHNFISETLDYYTNVLDVYLHRGNLYNLISPFHIQQIITSAHANLPSTIQIISSPIQATKIEYDKKFIRIFGYFNIVGIANFTMMRITPIPVKVENNSYWIQDISSGILAVDYDLQLYFQLSEEEFKSSIIVTATNYVCSPTAVQNLETSPNCIIDEIYQRPNPVQCPVTKNTIYETIWKELHTDNAWMVIVTKPIQVAITCSGHREDAWINQTCILQIPQDCIIKTKQHVLIPNRIDAVPILAGYIKPITISANTSSVHKAHQDLHLVEPVYKMTDKINNLRNQEEVIHQELAEETWRSIQHNSWTSSGITAIITLSSTAILIYGYRYWKKYQERTKRESTSNSESNPEAIYSTVQRMVDLQPLQTQFKNERPQNV